MALKRIGGRPEKVSLIVPGINLLALSPCAPVTLDGAPVGQSPLAVRTWFDDAADAIIPAFDGTLQTARAAARAYARHAKAENTRRAYRAGVRAWCAWCDDHGLPCLPARSIDIVAFLASERGRGMGVNTVDVRRAADDPGTANCRGPMMTVLDLRSSKSES